MYGSAQNRIIFGSYAAVFAIDEIENDAVSIDLKNEIGNDVHCIVPFRGIGEYPCLINGNPMVCFSNALNLNKIAKYIPFDSGMKNSMKY